MGQPSERVLDRIPVQEMVILIASKKLLRQVLGQSRIDLDRMHFCAGLTQGL